MTHPGYREAVREGQWLPGDSEILEFTLPGDRVARLGEIVGGPLRGTGSGPILTEIAAAAGVGRIAVVVLEKGETGDALRARLYARPPDGGDAVPIGEKTLSPGEQSADAAAKWASERMLSAGWPAARAEGRERPWYHNFWLWAAVVSVAVAIAVAVGGSGGCRSFIQLSSVDVYGLRPPLPLSEAVVPDPADYYALAKFTGEGLLRLGLEAACPLAVLRLPGVYGPADQGRSLVGGLVRKILAGQPVLLSSQGRLRRDCLAVADLAWIVERLLETPRPLLVNVASGESFSLLELVALIGEIGGVRPEVSLAGDETGEGRGDLVYDLGLLRRNFPQFRPRPLRHGMLLLVPIMLPRTLKEIYITIK